MQFPHDNANLIITRCLSKDAVVANRSELYVPMYDCAKSTLYNHCGEVNSILLLDSEAPLIDTTKPLFDTRIAKHLINMLV